MLLELDSPLFPDWHFSLDQDFPWLVGRISRLTCPLPFGKYMFASLPLANLGFWFNPPINLHQLSHMQADRQTDTDVNSHGWACTHRSFHQDAADLEPRPSAPSVNTLPRQNPLAEDTYTHSHRFPFPT